MSLRCRWKGHDWFPDLGQREFIVSQDICLRCNAPRVRLPWGQCLGGHPIAEHYDDAGAPIEHPTCRGPA